MGKYKSLGINSIYVMIGTLGSKLITFLMMPLYTLWLSVEDFGLTDLLTVYSTLLVSIFTLSLGESIFVFPVNKPKTEQTKYFTSGFVAILFMSIVVFLIGLIFSFYVQNYNLNNSFTDNLSLIFGLYITSAIQSYLQLFCKGINRMKTFCYAGVIYTLVTAVFSFLFIPSFGVQGFVWSNICANFISSLFIFLNERINEYFKVDGFNMSVLIHMIKYSTPLIPNAIMWWLLSAINRPILESHLGLVAIGLFAVANKFSSAISSISGIFVSSWQVSVLQEYGKKGFATFYNRIGTFYITILTIISIFIATFSKELVTIVVDFKFLESWKYLSIICIAIVMNGISAHTGTIFSATKTSKYFFISSFYGAITSVLFNLILIPFVGLYGAAISFVLSQLMIAVIRAYFANKFIKIENLLKIATLIIINIISLFFILSENVFLSYFLLLLSILMFVLINWEILIAFIIKIKRWI